MAWFTYRCPECGVEWDERCDRDDPDLDRGDWCPNPETFCESVGVRVRFRDVPAVQTTEGPLRTR